MNSRKQRFRPTVYLAGKITGAPWRNDILSLDTVDHEVWPVAERAIEGFADYVGPFPSKNFCGNTFSAHEIEKMPHGSLVIPWQHYSVGWTKHCIFYNCLEAIKRTNFFFAFIESVNDVGTIAEVGFAVCRQGQMAKLSRDSDDWCPISVEVWFSSDELRTSMWFVGLMADGGGRVCESPTDAWMQSQTLEWILARKARAELSALHESPIESALADAILARPWGQNLKAQIKIGRYRADLALPDHRIAIECDGHAYHSTKEQRTHDAARDRFFMSEGWRVVRCTGTEIHANVSKVVADIQAIVESEKAASAEGE